MLDYAPIINLLAPLFAAFAACAFGMWRRQIALPIAIIGLSVSLISSLGTLLVTAKSGAIAYNLGGWAPPIGIAFHIDNLNALVVVLIHLVALLTVIHSGPVIIKDIGNKRHFFYTLYLLFVTGITGISQTADAFNLYVLIEVASLTSYALISVGERRSIHAGFNYLIMGSIGATFYLLGVGYLYIKTGTLNMQDLHAVITANQLITSPTVQVAIAMIMLGLWFKMALFPFHGWLPNAYTWSPVTSASLMAPLMTKVMIYVMIRFMLVVFGLQNILDIVWAQAMPFIAVAAILFGSFMALAQRNLRRIFTYIIVAEIGYMVGAAWLGTERGLTASFYHILSDSLMTLCLFLAAGALAFKHGIKRIDQFEGAYAKAPLSMGIFTVGALSIIGIPPSCGFFSKWYLLGAGVESGNWVYVAALIISSFVSAVIFFRIFEIACFGNNPEAAHHGHDSHDETTENSESKTIHEAPISMLIPGITVAAMILLLGIFNQGFIQLIQTTINSLSTGGGL